jgi:hypothetical protein
VLVQWFLSPQHRGKRYLGNSGSIMHGLLPFAFNISVIFSTTFLKMSRGFSENYCFLMSTEVVLIVPVLKILILSAVRQV